MKKYKNFILLIFFVSIIAVTSGCKKNQSKNNTILIVMADRNFYDPEYTMPREKLEELGFKIEVANVSGGVSFGMRGLNVQADLAIKDADEKKYAALILVGGYGAESLYDNKELIKLVCAFDKSEKVIGAQCFTPVVVAQAGLLKGEKATCYESQASKLESYGVTYTGEVTERIDNILTAPAGDTEGNITAFINEYISMLGMGNKTISSSEDLSNLKKYDLSDFDKIHSPVDGSDNEFLILGNIPIVKPDKNLPAKLTGLIGRWEGYDLRPPVTKDIKIVLSIQEVTKKDIKGYIWHTTNLQYPNKMNEFRVNITNKNPYQFEIKSSLLTHRPSYGNLVFTYDKNNNQLTGEEKLFNGESYSDPGNAVKKDIALSRGDNFKIYKDYDKYLASKRIYIKEYKEKSLQDFGKGYIYYLPEDYEKDKKKKWPLLVFLHGTGDRGDNIHLIAKASPFMIIREKQDIPFIIAAPLLNNTGSYRSFPTEYMDDFLTKISKEYQVDAVRIYVTGLSMGGEACYRYAIYHPERVAALAPLCAPLLLDDNDLRFKREGWPLIEKPLSNLKNIPVWTIGGGKDIFVPKEAVLKIADTVKEAGVNVKITILEENDHDVWTDTYSDPAFYDWFLQYKK